MVFLKVAFGETVALFGVMCLVAGTFEVIAEGVRPVAFLDEAFPRYGPQRSDSWSPVEWRKGGSLVFGVGVILLLGAASALVA